MNIRVLILLILTAWSIGEGKAQVENLALQFTPTGTVDCGGLPGLDNLNSYSLQLWINPAEWEEEAVVLKRDNDFSLKLGAPGILNFQSGNSVMNIKNEDLKAGEWTQLTIICDEGKARAIVNGKECGSAELAPIGKSTESLILGGNYTGLMDEVRLWNDALNEDMATFDYFTNNTLNKWCPMWDNLLVYYKTDQKDCPYLVDYKGIDDVAKKYNNHGVLNGGVSKVSANNSKMPYQINGAYVQTDRALNWDIPEDQYLLSNQLLILGADAYSDGHIKEKTPNNHAALRDIYAGREGVKVFMCIQGTYRVRDQFGDWREILGDENKHKIFAEDLAELSKDYDGVELDLEWIEKPEQWKQFGQLARTIREALPEEKEFRISLHNNYCDFPVEDMEVVDGFTFQQYGPNKKNFSYENFLSNVEKFKNNYDREKIMTSYSTTTSKGENGSPVKMTGFEVIEGYSLNGKDEDTYSDGEDIWTYAGPMQVYKRAKHTRENDLQGIFYWDMAGDQKEEGELGKFNHAKFCSYGINANNDKKITDLVVNHINKD